MIAARNSGNTSPLTWVGSYPVYVSTVLAAVHSVALVLATLFMAAGARGMLLAMFGFSSSRVLGDFAIWQFVTYAFVQTPDILFLLEIYLLVVFGREIETFLGRSAFLKLYATLLLLPPLVLSVAGIAGYPTWYEGSSALHFGVFIAFATLYPGAQIFFSIQARWVAIALLAISVLRCLAYSQMTDLAVLLLDAGAAFAAIQLLSGSWTFHLPAAKSHLRVVEPVRERRQTVPETTIDAILEKISKSGMASLTVRERVQLEKARAELLEKEKNH